MPRGAFSKQGGHGLTLAPSTSPAGSLCGADGIPASGVRGRPDQREHGGLDVRRQVGPGGDDAGQVRVVWGGGYMLGYMRRVGIAGSVGG